MRGSPGSFTCFSSTVILIKGNSKSIDEQAEHIITTGEADAVFLARAMLRNPRWALMASEKLGHRIDWALPLDRGRTV